jgi:hypothetical protein
MKILIDYSKTSQKVISVENADYMGDYVLEILFSDQSRKKVSYKEFLSKSQHHSIIKYLNEESFSKFKIIDGNLNWNDCEMIFSISDLYEGKI